MKKKTNLFASFQREKMEAIRKEKQLEKEAKREKKAATKKDKKHDEYLMRVISPKRLLFCLVISAALFGLCLVLIKKMTEQELTIPLVVSIGRMERNEVVDDSKLTIKEIPVSMMPEDAIRNMDSIDGYFTVCEIGKNQILTSSLFKDKQSKAPEIENPLEISVGVKSIDQIVGGTIREGDLINITVIKQEAEAGKAYYVPEPLIERAYVRRTFTSTGINVESSDQEQSVLVINILIPADKEKEYNAALLEGTLRISRICQ